MILPEEFNLRDEQVVAWHLDELVGAIPDLPSSVLIEDMAQIAVTEELILDVGWYPEGSKSGRFIISLVKCFDWDHPLTVRECQNENDLRSILRELLRLPSDECAD